MSEPDLQKLRVAVAEAEGFCDFGVYYGPDWDKSSKLQPTHGIFNGQVMPIPDYLTDRNAIIGAIVRRFVTGDDRTKFERALMDILGRHWLPFDVATATAEQLCRAYLSAAGPPAEGQPK